jgi:hypothetical protein
MARKKSRQAAAVQRRTAAPAAVAPSIAITAAPQTQAPAAPVNRPAAAAERSVLEITTIRVSKWLGSLQVAVIGLSLFAAVVTLGTFMEHYYSTKIAQDLVYRSWWFIGLLLLLAVNIFFAAAKKWPWKKHQTGFVVTHIGLLMLLFGGILNAWFGVDASMELVDTTNARLLDALYKQYGISNSSGFIVYRDTSMITVREVDAPDPHDGVRGAPRKVSGPKAKPVEADFEGGPLPWTVDAKTAARTNLNLSMLNWLASPLGKSWSADIDNNVRMEIFDYLPFSSHDPYSPTDKRTGFPAIKLEFKTNKFLSTMDDWMAFITVNPYVRIFGGGDSMPGARIEFIGHCPQPLLDEFLQPPAPKDLGKKGILMVVAGGAMVSIPVDSKEDQWIDVGKGAKVRVLKYIPDWLEPKAEAASDAAVELEVKIGSETLKERVYARRTGLVTILDGKNDHEVLQSKDDPVLLWYHPPDFKCGMDNPRGLLQFVLGDDGRLYYRSFTGADFVRELSGSAMPGGDFVPFWQKMGGKFRIPEFLPSATRQDRYYAAPVTPGKETQDEKNQYKAAIHFRITDGKDKYEGWLRRSTRRKVDFKGRTFEVTFGDKNKNLGFTIKLARAEQQVDPGTRAPATYTSWVEVYDKAGALTVEKMITMNEPLEFEGYKFYQSQYIELDMQDDSGKPVSLSGFTVGSDPGLPMKYLGSICLALGIFIMFYMRAYFFKKRATKPLAA